MKRSRQAHPPMGTSRHKKRRLPPVKITINAEEQDTLDLFSGEVPTAVVIEGLPSSCRMQGICTCFAAEGPVVTVRQLANDDENWPGCSRWLVLYARQHDAQRVNKFVSRFVDMLFDEDARTPLCHMVEFELEKEPVLEEEDMDREGQAER